MFVYGKEIPFDDVPMDSTEQAALEQQPSLSDDSDGTNIVFVYGKDIPLHDIS